MEFDYTLTFQLIDVNCKFCDILMNLEGNHSLITDLNNCMQAKNVQYTTHTHIKNHSEDRDILF